MNKILSLKKPFIPKILYKKKLLKKSVSSCLGKNLYKNIYSNTLFSTILLHVLSFVHALYFPLNLECRFNPRE